MSSVNPIVPPATIGMLGGGQLGRYALVAANAMGYRTIVLDPDPGAPTGVIANEHLVAAYDDPDALAELERRCMVVTTEFENPPAAALDRLAASVPVVPSPDAVRIAQDRIAEKSFLAANGLPVGPHLAVRVGDEPDATSLAEVVGGGAIVKTARLGYDGKGQRSLDSADQFAALRADLGDVDLMVEQRLDLVTEVSVLVVRSIFDGEAQTVTFPVAENAHVNGILDVSVVPAPIDPALADRAVDLALGIAGTLDYVGVLAVEMFVVADSGGGLKLFINELAPRPHNSGHWTIDMAATSQFEQQIRAVCGVGLGRTDLIAPAAAMVNLLGDRWFDADGTQREPTWERALAHPDARLHLYGKAEPRPGRKMGHLTVSAASPGEACELALDLRSQLT